MKQRLTTHLRPVPASLCAQVDTLRRKTAAKRSFSFWPRSTDLEDALGIISEKQGFCFLTESEFVDAFNTFARRPERMVRAEQHSMRLAFAYVIDEVPLDTCSPYRQKYR